MQFSSGRPDLIRAINQRWLLKFWQQHRGSDHVPQWRTVKAEELTRLADSLNLLDVSGHGANMRFRLRLHCATFAKAYLPTDCTRKYLDEVVRPDRFEIAVQPYYQAVNTGCPVYTIHDVKDRCDQLVHFERLLLPFARDGKAVDRILASFEFISPDGAFDGEGLLTMHPLPSALQLAAIIETPALV